MRLLLLSNSANPGEPWLEWPLAHIEAHLAGARDVFFVPYAAVRTSWDHYTDALSRRLAPLGCQVHSAHAVASPAVAVRDAAAIAIGGGNTFQLLRQLYISELIEPIRHAVERGARYLGWSAGSVVACPTIRTTNDMPIAEPPSFTALALVPFQINAHYTEARLPNHNGETRPERLEEFLATNPGSTVAALPEGTGILVEDAAARLIGASGCTIYRANQSPESCPAGSDLSFLLDSSTR